MFRPTGGTLELAGSVLPAGRAGASTRGRGCPGARRRRPRAGKVLASRSLAGRQPLHSGAHRGRGGCGIPVAARGTPSAAARRERARARPLRRRASLHGRGAGARRARRRSRAGRPRAQRALRARAPVALAGTAAGAGESRARPASSIPRTCSTQVVQQAPSTCSRPTAPRCGCSRTTSSSFARPAVHGSRGVTAARVPSTTWLVGDIVQSRSARAIGRRGGDTRASEADPMLASTHRGVPRRADDLADRSVHGVLAVYSQRPREWREEESEALHALAGQRSRGAHDRRALPGRQARAAAKRSDPRERRRRHRRRRPRRRRRALEPGGGAHHRRGRRRGARPEPGAGARTAARDRGAGRQPQPPRPDPPRLRRGLALAERGGDDRSGRGGRRPDLRLPRHLRRARGRADEVGLRLHRLPRAPHAADVDLRVRRDPAAAGRPLRRGGAARRSFGTSPRSRSA